MMRRKSFDQKTLADQLQLTAIATTYHRLFAFFRCYKSNQTNPV